MGEQQGFKAAQVASVAASLIVMDAYADGQHMHVFVSLCSFRPVMRWSRVSKEEALRKTAEALVSVGWHKGMSEDDAVRLLPKYALAL
jgi:hypothetical protein